MGDTWEHKTAAECVADCAAGVDAAMPDIARIWATAMESDENQPTVGVELQWLAERLQHYAVMVTIMAQQIGGGE